LGEDALVRELEAVAAPPRAATRHLWVARRLALGVVTLFLVSILVFAATQALPADPAEAILGKTATPARLTVLREELGLNRPLVSQYLDWLRGALTGDLGVSLSAHVPVSQLIGRRLGNSLVLLLFVAVIAIPGSLVLGSLSAIRRDGFVDKTGQLLSLGLTALPEFVTGMVLIILLGTTVFTVLPAVALIPPGESPFGHLKELVLPVATLTIAVTPYLFRVVRASMIDALSSDYVQMARLKGMPERIVMRRHALPNALIPVVQASALVLTFLLGGVLVVEFLFGYPGLGSLLASAVAARDLPLIQAVTLVFAVGVVLFGLVADVLTVLLTPRLRTRTR
jgi:peptide/nickel transport system permease protein